MKDINPWEGITKPLKGQLSAQGKEIIWYAIDDLGCPHLLISVSPVEPTVHLFNTRGVTAEITELDPEGGPRGKWIDITCVDPTTRDTFALLTRDITDAITKADDPPHTIVVNILERWRWFWSSKPNVKPLSHHEALGLLAELWFFRYWLDSPAAVQCWRGPLGDRHDFVHPDMSIEVKATTVHGEGDITHIITHIDQLDKPSKGILMLFSLALSPDTLAKPSLASIVDVVDNWMLDTSYTQIWRKRLHQAGWSPAHASQYRDTYRIVQEGLYQVDNGFPRIVRSAFINNDLPVGVSGLTYTINTTAASTHLLASKPAQAQKLLAPMCNSIPTQE